jgi:gluconokinase
VKNPPVRSPRDQVGGLVYFGRMLDKIRLHLRGELPEDYRENFGDAEALDGWMARFLGLEHREVVARTAAGGSDDEILEWCFAQGQRPNETQMRVWNGFAEKLGWHDSAAATVARVNKRLGLDGKLATIFDCLDADEGRLRLGENAQGPSSGKDL